MEKGTCELCRREPVELTVHHLIPKEEGGRFSETANLCIPCHKQIHFLYTNAELALLYATIESLRNAPDFKKFLKWLRKQPASALPRMKKSNRLKRRR
ncbi:HNH endonuclease [Fictibacillus sp. b24]|uniref:HNH endonuclease n=1 Tax=Fictibacillus sp. b24 TaxID=3055863 RepID=UPI0025A02912|nr:HNH endonuclease [Fictibacillus sp. b24]MDM5316797.1 HNH endonuclease [Fictibacillus sp. b24]